MELTHLQRVQRAIRFIEDHLAEPITIADAADVACYSLYHFCRTFNSVAHHSPYDYLMRRRLSEAARHLVESRSRIIDIAFEYQFNSPESFSRAFKKMFGIQPKQFRSRATIDRRCILEALSAHHLDLMNRATGPIPERIRLQTVTACGLMSLIQGESAAAGRLWEDLDDRSDTKREDRVASTGLSRYIGIASFPRGWRRSGFYYLAGVGQQDNGPPNPVLITNQLPGGSYARFRFTAKLNELQLILEYVIQTWLPKSDRASDIPFVVFSYGKKPQPVDDAEIEQHVFVPLR